MSTELEDRLKALEAEVAELKAKAGSDPRDNSVAIVCFSGEWDRLFAAFTIANGALALGMELDMFFTFWGATAVRNGQPASGRNQSILQQAFSRMLPKSAQGAPLSRFHFFGLGKVLMQHLMKKKNVEDLPVLIARAEEMGARMHFCDTSLDLFGWGPEDMRAGGSSDWCGVSTFLSLATKSRSVLFI